MAKTSGTGWREHRARPDEPKSFPNSNENVSETSPERLSTDLRLSADQVTEMTGMTETSIAILLHGSDQQRQESVDKFLRVRSCCTEVDQLDL